MAGVLKIEMVLPGLFVSGARGYDLKRPTTRKSLGGSMARFMSVLAACLFVFGAGVARPADTATELVIYDTALASGWENWSWAKVEPGIELTGSTRRPIKVEAGPWTALYLHHAPFSTAPHRALSFLIQGTVPEGEVRAFSLTDGKVNGEGYLVKFNNTGWTRVVIPLATLGAIEKPIDGFWLQNASAAELAPFFVTEIKLGDGT
jgi:hypothetical protein